MLLCYIVESCEQERYQNSLLLITAHTALRIVNKTIFYSFVLKYVIKFNFDINNIFLKNERQGQISTFKDKSLFMFYLSLIL